MMAANCLRLTATGVATAVDSYLQAVVLTPAAEAATVTVRAGGPAGTVLMNLTAAASGASVVVGGLRVYCADGIHVTLVGAGAEASVVYE